MCARVRVRARLSSRALQLLKEREKNRTGRCCASCVIIELVSHRVPISEAVSFQTAANAMETVELASSLQQGKRPLRVETGWRDVQGKVARGKVKVQCSAHAHCLALHRNYHYCSEHVVWAL